MFHRSLLNNGDVRSFIFFAGLVLTTFLV